MYLRGENGEAASRRRDGVKKNMGFELLTAATHTYESCVGFDRIQRVWRTESPPTPGQLREAVKVVVRKRNVRVCFPAATARPKARCRGVQSTGSRSCANPLPRQHLRHQTQTTRSTLRREACAPEHGRGCTLPNRHHFAPGRRTRRTGDAPSALGLDKRKVENGQRAS